jgi:hypothetical protein
MTERLFLNERNLAEMGMDPRNISTLRKLAEFADALTRIGDTEDSLGLKQPLDADLTAIAALTTAAAGRSVLTLADPAEDRIAFWDDSADSAAWLQLGTGLNISGTTLSANSFRGALVKKAADQIGANYSGAGAVVTWDAEDYDTDTIHSTSSNTSRLTVPIGVTKIRIKFSLLLSNVTANSTVLTDILKNGSSGFNGTQAGCDTNATTSVRYGGETATITVTSGDYFELHLNTADPLIDINATYSWFAMEIVE